MPAAIAIGNACFSENDVILLDTSAVLAAAGFLDNESSERDSREILRMAARAKAIVALSVLSGIEISGALIRKGICGEFNGRNFSQSDLRAFKMSSELKYNAIIDRAVAIRDSLLGTFLSAPCTYPELLQVDGQTLDLASRLMRKYRFQSENDALHPALALRHGIPYFFTTDSDYLRLKEDGLTVITDTYSFGKQFRFIDFH